jgi:RNAse (barnase) inhibitor barstar
MGGIELRVTDEDGLDALVDERRQAGATVGVIDGREARTEPAFFAAVAEALDLPDWFGANWDALDEVLADRSWLPGSPHVLVVRHAVWLLEDEPQERLKILVDVLGAAASGEPDPNDRSGGVPLSPPPLEVVLHATPDDEDTLRARYAGVGADLS